MKLSQMVSRCCLELVGTSENYQLMRMERVEAPRRCRVELVGTSEIHQLAEMEEAAPPLVTINSDCF